MKMKEKVLSMVKILVGVALTDIALGMIVLPQSFAAGGVTGLCVILSKDDSITNLNSCINL